MQLSVLYLANLHPNKLGSIEETALFLAKKLKEQGNRCTLAFASAPPDWLAKKFIASGAELETVDLGRRLFTEGKPNRKYLRSAWQLYRIIRKHRVNLVHVNFLSLSHPAMLAVYLNPKIKLIYTEHASGQESQRSRIKKISTYFFRQFINWRVAKFIAVSNYVRNRMIAAHKINAKKTVTIYNAVNLQRFSNGDGEQFRKELNITPSTKVISTVAMLIPEKGVHNVIAAMPRIIADIPDVVLLIVGEGYYETILRKMAIEMDIEKYVRFLGLRSDVDSVYTGSDVVVVPSVWQEAFGLANVEAMACGKPVVATNVGGIPEIITSDETGILVPAQNAEAIGTAVVRLCRDTAFSMMIASNAREKARQQFNQDTMLYQMIEIYYNTFSRM